MTVVHSPGLTRDFVADGAAQAASGYGGIRIVLSLDPDLGLFGLSHEAKPMGLVTIQPARRRWCV